MTVLASLYRTKAKSALKLPKKHQKETLSPAAAAAAAAIQSLLSTIYKMLTLLSTLHARIQQDYTTQLHTTRLTLMCTAQAKSHSHFRLSLPVRANLVSMTRPHAHVQRMQAKERRTKMFNVLC